MVVRWGNVPTRIRGYSLPIARMSEGYDGKFLQHFSQGNAKWNEFTVTAKSVKIFIKKPSHLSRQHYKVQWGMSRIFLSLRCLKELKDVNTSPAHPGLLCASPAFWGTTVDYSTITFTIYRPIYFINFDRTPNYCISSCGRWQKEPILINTIR